MDKPMHGKKIALLVANGFDEVDMTETQKALVKQGAQMTIISSENGLVNSWHGTGWGHHFAVEQPIGSALAADYDMMLIPGGERSFTKLMQTAHTKRMIRGMMDADKPVIAMGHAVGLLADAERLQGRTVTAIEAQQEMITKAGAVLAETSHNIDGQLFTAIGGEASEELLAAVISFVLGAPEAGNDNGDAELKNAA